MNPGPGSSSSAETNNGGALIMGLQQCFTQLHLHSLEIQALSKHVQVRPSSPFYPYNPYCYPYWQGSSHPPAPPPPPPFM